VARENLKDFNGQSTASKSETMKPGDKVKILPKQPDDAGYTMCMEQYAGMTSTIESIDYYENRPDIVKLNIDDRFVWESSWLKLIPKQKPVIESPFKIEIVEVLK